ncbi:hypothetical protein LNTAR_06989 [Lentisphaera araneosa HTCC2155]|uniref:Prepilin-type N-terminal cleavage/methylation domain-containing protein n=1 Tax=Lentisphaera araneosa HTCC2155 TaxID=313628 RepID=A6DMT3_9BACT|nr:prepilin-type N-terminal cleavage/methylation domain-containing protein [Lentisphaera araneosa]EDM26969.1 hypothetical protein LNTAR_06989 [Lentisphaera araneosa HTCC2155]
MMKKFSLIEILVVVAIIGILASLLVPSLKSARKKSKSAVCKSTIGQLGVSAYIFADDNDGRIPISGAAGSLPNTSGIWWTNALKDGGYVQWTEAAMTCPSMPYDGGWSDEKVVTYGAPRPGKVVRAGEITSPYNGFKLNEVESPSELFWYSDSAKSDNGVLKQWNNFEYWYKNRGRTSALRIHARHSERANLWFADGHVSSHWLGSMKQLGIDYIFTENGTALSF